MAKTVSELQRILGQVAKDDKSTQTKNSKMEERVSGSMRCCLNIRYGVWIKDSQKVATYVGRKPHARFDEGTLGRSH